MATGNVFGLVPSSNHVGHMNTRQGATLRGRFVRLPVDGRVIAARGSGQKDENIASDETPTKELIGTAPPASPAIPNGVVR